MKVGLVTRRRRPGLGLRPSKLLVTGNAAGEPGSKAPRVPTVDLLLLLILLLPILGLLLPILLLLLIGHLPLKFKGLLLLLLHDLHILLVAGVISRRASPVSLSEANAR